MPNTPSQFCFIAGGILVFLFAIGFIVPVKTMAWAAFIVIVGLYLMTIEL